MSVTIRKWLYLVAFVFVALALGPALAHLFALPNKIGLDEARYFTVQQIYAGWALLGIVVIGALLSTLALAVALRRDRGPALWALVAFLCLAGTQLIFWSFTFPANQATVNWTEIPASWQALRVQWEYSHAASAVLNLAAMIALALSVLAWRTGAQE